MITKLMQGKTIVIAKMEREDGQSILMLELDDGTVCEITGSDNGVTVHFSTVDSQPTSPQTKRQGPFIPTIQDLHEIFSEEETKARAETMDAAKALAAQVVRTTEGSNLVAGLAHSIEQACAEQGVKCERVSPYKSYIVEVRNVEVSRVFVQATSEEYAREMVLDRPKHEFNHRTLEHVDDSVLSVKEEPVSYRCPHCQSQIPQMFHEPNCPAREVEPCPEAEHIWVYQRSDSGGSHFRCNTCGSEKVM